MEKDKERERKREREKKITELKRQKVIERKQ